MSSDTTPTSSWRNNPALVYCYDSFRLELQAIKNNQPFRNIIYFNNDVSYRRKQLGLTQKELSTFAEVSITSLSMAENNKAGHFVMEKLESTLSWLEANQRQPAAE